jgi:phosphoglycolate phosphatase-like HAD superfamily hydrolase
MLVLWDIDRTLLTTGGADGKSRRDLVPVALDRYARLAGVPIAPGKVVIIGDTPRDIDCARANGCRSLAVATGRFPKEALDKAGADLVLEDLMNTEKILAWIFR